MNLLLFAKQSWLKASTINPLTRTFNTGQIAECRKEIPQVALRGQKLSI
jgi:hypothetical protein